MAGLGVPSDSPDAALLLAWLARCPGAPLGLVLRLPVRAPAAVAAHVCHLLQRMLKVGCEMRWCRGRAPQLHMRKTLHAGLSLGATHAVGPRHASAIIKSTVRCCAA